MKPSLTGSAAACAALAVKLNMAAVTRPHAERRASVLFILVSIGCYGRLVRAIRQDRKYPLGTNEVKASDPVVLSVSCGPSGLKSFVPWRSERAGSRMRAGWVAMDSGASLS